MSPTDCFFKLAAQSLAARCRLLMCTGKLRMPSLAQPPHVLCMSSCKLGVQCCTVPITPICAGTHWPQQPYLQGPCLQGPCHKGPCLLDPCHKGLCLKGPCHKGLCLQAQACAWVICLQAQAHKKLICTDTP